MYGDGMVVDSFSDSEGDGLDVGGDGWTPILRSPEEFTPLPLIDFALPVMLKFGKLVGHGPLARYRIAILRELAAIPRSQLRMRVIQDAIGWMEPSSVTRLVRDLRRGELVAYDERGDFYRLNREARVVAAICGALTAVDVDYTRIIKVLSATMRLGDAMNAPDASAYQTFLSAIAVLEYDYDELRRLLADQSQESLLEAARLATGHVEDMRTLLEEQEDMFARHSGDMDFLDLDQQAHHLIARLGGLAADVVTGLSWRADVRLRGSLRVDRDDLRAMVREASVEELAGVMGDGVVTPVFMVGIDTVAAFASLEQYLQRTHQSPPTIPAPVDLGIDDPPDPDEDLIRSAAAAIELLATGGGRQLWEWVVGDSWTGALRRNALAIEAWARFGPAGDGSLRAGLHPEAREEALRRDGVGWMSATRVEQTAGGASVDAG